MSCVRIQAVRNPAITVDQLDLAGDRPDTPPYELHPKDDKPHLQEKIDAHMQFVLTTSHWPELEEEKERREDSLDRPDLALLTDDELRNLVTYIRTFVISQ